MTVLRLFDGATPWTADPGRLQAVKQHGGIAVSVYVVGSPGGMRCANKADVAAARALDLGVLPNWERAVDALCSGGKANGQTVGAEALAACRALGFPDDGTVAVPFSWDVQIPAGKLDDCGQVADGIIAGLAGHYLFTAYGPQNLVDYLHSTGRLQSAAWLTASTFGQPYNPAAPYVAVVQSHDAAGNWLNSPVAGTDVNTITQPDRLAAWWPDNSPYGGDMPLDPKDPVIIDLRQRIGAVQDQLAYGAGNHPNNIATVRKELAAVKAELDQLKTMLTAGVTVAAVDIPATLHIGAQK